MAEPDHIFLRPLPNLGNGELPAAYPFFYIKPAENEKLMRKFFPVEKGPVTNIDPIGNSPVIIRKVPIPFIVKSCLVRVSILGFNLKNCTNISLILYIYYST